MPAYNLSYPQVFANSRWVPSSRMHQFPYNAWQINLAEIQEAVMASLSY